MFVHECKYNWLPLLLPAHCSWRAHGRQPHRTDSTDRTNITERLYHLLWTIRSSNYYLATLSDTIYRHHPWQKIFGASLYVNNRLESTVHYTLDHAVINNNQKWFSNQRSITNFITDLVSTKLIIAPNPAKSVPIHFIHFIIMLGPNIPKFIRIISRFWSRWTWAVYEEKYSIAVLILNPRRFQWKLNAEIVCMSK